MTQGGIHHLLSRAFGQCVSVSEVIDFDVTDVISVCDVHVAVDCSDGACFHSCARGRRFHFGGTASRSNRRDVDMLDTFFGLHLGLDARCDGSYQMLIVSWFKLTVKHTRSSSRIQSWYLCRFPSSWAPTLPPHGTPASSGISLPGWRG